MNNEQKKSDERILAQLLGEYKRVCCEADSVRICVNDIDFEETIPDAEERYLMVEQMKVNEEAQAVLRNRIRYYRNRIKANKPEPWEENNAFRTVETLCGPVNLINQDKVSKVEMDDIIHHCGQDADMDDACCQAAYDPNESQPVDTKPAITGESLYKLLGRQVICFLKPGESRCENCQFNPDDPEDCVKVELVGGYFLCLADIQPNEGAF